MRNWLANAGSGLASQLSGAVSPFPDTPQFAAYKQAPRVGAAPTVTAAPPTPIRPPLNGMMSAFNAGARQPFGATPGFDSGARQPFEVLGPRQPGSGFDMPEAPSIWNGGGAAGSTGFGALDAHNNEFNSASQRLSAPANLLKAMVNRESSGNWERDGNRIATFQRHDGSWAEILPFVGITKAAADAWGLDFYGMRGNKQAQIDGMATIVSGLANKYGGWDNAIKAYFGGPAAVNGTFIDENNLDSNYYYNEAAKMWHDFDAMSGTDDIPTFSAAETGLGNNRVIQEALQFVGTPYRWGGIPGAGDDPRQTGWDCSGMTYWLDQKYGGGSLPMGSHYQYQYAQQTGQLFNDLSQLQPGDLVFINTGWQGGAGAELNPAGHVGVYIGNGQMLHAANQQQGTIVSPLSGYQNILGAMHQSFSGGGGFGGSSAPANPYRVRQSIWS